MNNHEAPNMPRWAYMLMAGVAAAIGLGASGVTAQFFILGLEKLEADPMARSLLVLTGILMIATELAAFGIAAMLPSKQLRAMKVTLIFAGALLLAFEAATIYITQAAIDQASEVEATSKATRIQELKASIESRRAAAKGLRENGQTQSASANAWTRTLGAVALRDALKVEEQIAPLSTELAQLQAATKPTMASVLGQGGMHAYGIVRGLLISTMGLVMFSAAGALLREGFPRKNAQPDQQAKPNNLRVVSTKATTYPQLRGLWSGVIKVGKGWCTKQAKTPKIPEHAPPKALRRA